MGREMAWLQFEERGECVIVIQVGWMLHMPWSTSSEGMSKEGDGVRPSTRQDTQRTRLNLIQMVDTFHLLSSIFELMFVVVQENGIGVKTLVDTGAMHS